MNSMAFKDSFLLPRFGVSIPYRACSKRAARELVLHATAVGGYRRRRPQNVEGEFFVDQRCIDCDTCRWMAPKTFRRVDEMSAVIKQPSSEEDRRSALQALLSCPTNSIHTEKPTKEIVDVQKSFPLAVDESRLPGIYYCGYHSEKSYGATAYLIIHPEGNILVDSPRYTEVLVRNIEILGGAKFMFLTHMDDVADHDKWSKRFGCKRILHTGDVEESTVDVEMKLCGDGPWSIGTEFELIHTPGHTEVREGAAWKKRVTERMIESKIERVREEEMMSSSSAILTLPQCHPHISMVGWGKAGLGVKRGKGGMCWREKHESGN